MSRLFFRPSARLDVHEHVVNFGNLSAHFVLYLVRDLMRSLNAHLRIHLHVHVHEEVVAHFSRDALFDTDDTGNGRRHGADFSRHGRTGSPTAASNSIVETTAAEMGSALP